MVNTPRIDSIIDIVSGKTPSDRKALAVEILKFITQQQAASEGKTGVDLDIDTMLLENAVIGLWGGYDRLQTVKGEDSAERLTRVKVDKQPVVVVEEPAPGPVPEFVPAQPLPSIPPTDTEMLARKESFATLEDRYAPAASAARVKAIVEEAERVFGPRTVIDVAPIAPSDAEVKAVSGINIASNDARVAQIVADSAKVPTTVEVIEAKVNADKSVQAQLEAAQANLERLKALRDAQ